jgi:hypothetical protein
MTDVIGSKRGLSPYSADPTGAVVQQSTNYSDIYAAFDYVFTQT